MIAGGFSNTASGNNSFAAGRRANANDDACFVWGDQSTTNEVRCDAPNRFVARSLGGVYFFSFGADQGTYNGVFLAPGATAWVVASDRRIKDNVRDINTQDVLSAVAGHADHYLEPDGAGSLDPPHGPDGSGFPRRVRFGRDRSRHQHARCRWRGLCRNPRIEAKLAERDAEVATMKSELAAIRSLLTTIAARPTQTAEIAR